jgi:thymidylate kinase
VKAHRARLISVDGVSGTAVAAAARTALGRVPKAHRAGVSVWDASGLFQDLAVAEEEAGTPSARTILLLYAADLAFRLRWEIRPALENGLVIVAAPYIDSAIALGRAAGLRSAWLTNLFLFAPRPAESHYVDQLPARSAPHDAGLLEFVTSRMVCVPAALSRDDLAQRMRARLSVLARRARPVRRVAV